MNNTTRDLNSRTQQQQDTAPERLHLSRETKFVLVAFLFSGAAALIYEVIWTRALSLVLGSTIYALSTMLGTFMGGLALGSYLGGKLSDRSDNLLRYFGFCELGIGITGLLSLPLIYSLPEVYLRLYRNLHFYPTAFFSIEIILCSLVMIIPTTLMGATFPLVSRHITYSLREMGRKVGDAYSFNTVGAVLGSLSVGFFLIPSLGIKGATYTAAGLNLFIGFGMLALSKSRPLKVMSLTLLLFLLSGMATAMTRMDTTLINFYTVFTYPETLSYDTIVEKLDEDMQLVYYKEFPEGPVRGYLTSKEGKFIIQVGAKREGSGSKDLPNELLLAYLPIASHQNPQSFLNIGLGTGMTLSTAKNLIKDTTVVEINPGAVEAVSQYGTPGLFEGVQAVVDDGRNYLFRSQRKFDIISSGPSYPTESGVGNLFTKEFYEIAAKKLNGGGIYTQWLPYYMMSNEEVTMMLKTFQSVFTHVYLWRTDYLDLIMVGSKKPFAFTTEQIEERIQRLNTDNEYLAFNLSRTPSQVIDSVADPEIPYNTDNRPLLEFSLAKNFLSGGFHSVPDPSVKPPGHL